VKLRAVSVAASTAGLLAGAALLAPSAQALERPQVNSVWNCTALSVVGSDVYGLECYGSGTGVGWFYLVSPSGNYIQEYRCTAFMPLTNFPDPRYNEEGTGCTYVGPAD
jgi:hypothetical protein